VDGDAVVEKDSGEDAIFNIRSRRRVDGVKSIRAAADQFVFRGSGGPGSDLDPTL
jgi:hypothetical protein